MGNITGGIGPTQASHGYLGEDGVEGAGPVENAIPAPNGAADGQIADVVMSIVPEARLLKGLSSFSKLSRVAQFGIRPYGALKRLIAGTGLQAHHLIERRFARLFGVKAGQMLSIAVTKEEHQIFTNRWRAAISYGKGTALATKASVENAARQVYKEAPEILKALGL